jgi:NitT/TauT family transport system permease protein
VPLQVARLAIVVALIIGWQLTADTWDTRFWTSSPRDILTQLHRWSDSGDLWRGLRVTVQETVFGYFLGGVAGAVVGFALGRLRRLGRVLEPFIMAIYSIPKIALAPLIVLWFGIGMTTKVFVSAVLVFFLVFLTTYSGTKQVNEELCDLARVMGASRFALLRKVVIPQAGLWVFTGLRIALPYALIGAVVGEFIAAQEGIGYLINNSSALINTTGVYAGLVVLMAVATVLTSILNVVEGRVLRWERTKQRENSLRRQTRDQAPGI